MNLTWFGFGYRHFLILTAKAKCQDETGWNKNNGLALRNWNCLMSVGSGEISFILLSGYAGLIQQLIIVHSTKKLY